MSRSEPAVKSMIPSFPWLPVNVILQRRREREREEANYLLNLLNRCSTWNGWYCNIAEEGPQHLPPRIDVDAVDFVGTYCQFCQSLNDMITLKDHIPLHMTTTTTTKRTQSRDVITLKLDWIRYQFSFSSLHKPVPFQNISLQLSCSSVSPSVCCPHMAHAERRCRHWGSSLTLLRRDKSTQL